MDAKNFVTNINCNGCLATVTPHLDKTVGEGNWKVDLNNPQKVLTVESETAEENICQAVRNAGFKIEKLI